MDQKLNSRFKLQQIQKVFIFATRVNRIDNAQVFKGVLQTGMTHILLIIHVTSQAAEGFFFLFFVKSSERGWRNRRDAVCGAQRSGWSSGSHSQFSLIITLTLRNTHAVNKGMDVGCSTLMPHYSIMPCGVNQKHISIKEHMWLPLKCRHTHTHTQSINDDVKPNVWLCLCSWFQLRSAYAH